MGRYTCAYSCEHAGDSDVKFFKFPLCNPRKLKKWLANMRLDGWSPSRFSVLCMDHFEEQYIDKTGKSVKLRGDAVPTLFSTQDHPQKRKTEVPINPRNKKPKAPAPKAPPSGPAQPTGSPSAAAKPTPPDPEAPRLWDSAGDPKKPEKWRIITDAGLVKISSFPHFFHGDYCVAQDIHWVPDHEESTECEDPEKLIEVTAPWQWLGLDVRGPLPQTLNGHRYVLTLTDYFSKWVEAVPVESCLPSCVVKHVVDVVAHFGFPLRILSRLPHDIVQKINKELKEQLKITIALVVHHHQTGTADLITQQLIDRMVNDLIEEHAADWDIYLPAKVFSLCFKEHSKTKERPFSVLCGAGLEPVQGPRGLDYTYTRVQESAFVIK